jgi:L-serine deaminase
LGATVTQKASVFVKLTASESFAEGLVGHPTATNPVRGLCEVVGGESSFRDAVTEALSSRQVVVIELMVMREAVGVFVTVSLTVEERSNDEVATILGKNCEVQHDVSPVCVFLSVLRE